MKMEPLHKKFFLLYILVFVLVPLGLIARVAFVGPFDSSTSGLSEILFYFLGMAGFAQIMIIRKSFPKEPARILRFFALPIGNLVILLLISGFGSIIHALQTDGVVLLSGFTIALVISVIKDDRAGPTTKKIKVKLDPMSWLVLIGILGVIGFMITLVVRYDIVYYIVGFGPLATNLFAVYYGLSILVAARLFYSSLNKAGSLSRNTQNKSMIPPTNNV